MIIYIIFCISMVYGSLIEWSPKVSRYRSKYNNSMLGTLSALVFTLFVISLFMRKLPLIDGVKIRNSSVIDICNSLQLALHTNLISGMLVSISLCAYIFSQIINIGKNTITPKCLCMFLMIALPLIYFFWR